MKLLSRLSIPTLIIAMLLGIALFLPSSASAALDGDNGPILFVENPEILKAPSLVQDCDCECECEESEVTPAPVSSVITTTPEGTNPTTAATSEDFIDDATISKPTENGEHTIVYATNTPICNYEYEKRSYTEEEEKCEFYYANGSEVALHIVTIDKNQNPTSNPTLLVTLPSLYEEGVDTYNQVEGLSFAEDGQNVLVTRSSRPSYNEINLREQGEDRLPRQLWTIENVHIPSGVVTTIVAPKYDPYLIGGYAQNGNIYFSQLNTPYSGGYEEEGLSEGSEYQVDVWFILAGQSVAQQLTNTLEISEFYIDASPDNISLLVADVTYCYYYKGVSSNNCTYYLVSTTDGSAVEQLFAENYTPVFFSPDGKTFVGTISYRGLDIARSFSLGSYDSIAIPTSYTAVAFRNALSDPQLLTGLIGVREWAPKLAVTRTSSTTTPAPVQQLAVTGLNSTQILVAAVSIMLSTIGLALFSKKKIA